MNIPKVSLTVREVFGLLYGPIPDDAGCYIGADCCNRGWQEGPCVSTPNGKEDDGLNLDGPTALGWSEKDQGWYHIGGHYPRAYGPDISDRPAEAFRGFFGEAYDFVIGAEN